MKVPYNEARYGRSDGFPCDDVVCDNTWELVRDAANAWVADQEAQGKTPGADQRRCSPSSTSGTATTTTSTATSTSPTGTSTTSRSCTPAATRPTVTLPGRGRHLEPPLVRLPVRLRRHRPSREPLRRHADRRHRHLDRRLHDPARERRPVGRSPTSTATTSACPTTTTPAGGDGNPTEWWTLMAPVAAERRQRDHRPPGRRHRCVAEARARLAGLRRSPRPATPGRIELGRAEYNTRLPQALIVGAPAEDGGERLRRPVRRVPDVLVGQGQRPAQHADPRARPDRASPRPRCR